MTRLLQVSGHARFLKIKDIWWTDGSLAPFKTAPLMFKNQQISISKAITNRASLFLAVFVKWEKMINID